MDEVRIPAAGDPFVTGDKQSWEGHACNDGWVTMGQMVLDPETGEEVERVEALPCRRCAEYRADGVY